MSEKAKAIRFVDDDADEVSRFRATFGGDYIVGAGPTLDEALGDLKWRRVKRPDLFLLDLYYGPDTKDEQRAAIANLDNQLSELERKMRALLAETG